MSEITSNHPKEPITLHIAGWNGFGQWFNSPTNVTSFTKVDLNDFFSCNKVESFDIQIDWAYVVIILNSKILLKGFCDEELDKVIKLTPPETTSLTNCACNDKHILFYNKNEKFVWKYSLDPNAEDRWKVVSNFVSQEKPSEAISKIVSSIRMNIALSSEGRIFNIPNEINNEDIDGKVVDIQCGYEHAILLTDKGNVYTWGGGSRCQLGIGSTKNSDEPILVEGLAGIHISKISAGGWHCCAISESGDLYTWGWNDKGQLGVYKNTDEIPKLSDEVKCEDGKHSSNVPGSSGDNSKRCQAKNVKTCTNSSTVLANYALPVLIDIFDSKSEAVIEKNVIDVDCGSKHTVVKLDDGTFWGTGCNKYGQLGFDNAIVENVEYFRKLDIDLFHGSIHCGIWTTGIVTIR